MLAAVGESTNNKTLIIIFVIVSLGITTSMDSAQEHKSRNSLDARSRFWKPTAPVTNLASNIVPSKLESRTEVSSALNAKETNTETITLVLNRKKVKFFTIFAVISVILIFFVAYKLYESEPKMFIDSLSIGQSKLYESIPWWIYGIGTLIIAGGVSYFLLSEKCSLFDPNTYLHSSSEKSPVFDSITYLHTQASEFKAVRGGNNYKYIEGMNYYDVNVFNSFNVSNVIANAQLKLLSPKISSNMSLDFTPDEVTIREVTIGSDMVSKFELSRVRLRVIGLAFDIIDKMKSHKETVERIKKNETLTWMKWNIRTLDNSKNKFIDKLLLYYDDSMGLVKFISNIDEMTRLEEILLKLRSEF